MLVVRVSLLVAQRQPSLPYTIPRCRIISESEMSPVEVYVYDLSKGLACQLSLQLTGKQIDGVWLVSSGMRSIYSLTTTYRHTSVVAFGKEIFYGPGICETEPGRSHVSCYGRKLVSPL